MNRLMITLMFIFFSFTTMANRLPSSEEFETTPGDASSDAFQQQIDNGDISPGTAHEIIDNGDFDSEDGGLYCPEGDCQADPEDISNGF
jgi:hypothetical protein